MKRTRRAVSAAICPALLWLLVACGGGGGHGGDASTTWDGSDAPVPDVVLDDVAPDVTSDVVQDSLADVVPDVDGDVGRVDDAGGTLDVARDVAGEDAPDIVEPGPLEVTAVEIVVPAWAPVGTPVPAVLRAWSGNEPARYVVAAGRLEWGDATLSEPVHRGAGARALPAATQPGPVPLLLVVRGQRAERVVAVGGERAERRVTGVLQGAELTWGPDEMIRVEDDVSVPDGQTLTIEPGTWVALAAGANLVLEGAAGVDAAGSRERPIVFAPAEESPWGGVVHGEGASRYAWTLFTGGGGDVSRAFGHSGSQPVLMARGGTLRLEDCGLVSCPGKALGGLRAELHVARTVLARCDTGGEIEYGWLSMEDSHVLYMPDADGLLEDDDNDGFYLRESMLRDGERLASEIQRCVFAVGEDDGLDQNGADVVVSDSWFEGFAHEGVACSNGGTVTVQRCVVQDCEQGIEAGYGAPKVTVDHSVLLENGVGLRFGDGYDRAVTGRLVVKNSISVDSLDHNVLNHVIRLGGPREGALTVSHSYVDDPDWDGREGNLPGRPALDATMRLLRGEAGIGAADDGADIGLPALGGR